MRSSACVMACALMVTQCCAPAEPKAFAAPLSDAPAGRSAGGAPGKTLQMEDVIRLQMADVKEISFSGDELLGTYTEPGRDPVIAKWGKSGRQTLAAGGAGGRSPNGRWLLYVARGTWRLRDLRTGTERTYGDGKTPFGFVGLPVWSADSRYVATNFDLQQSKSSQDAPVAVSQGVRFQDVTANDEANLQRILHDTPPQRLIWGVDQPQPSVIESPLSDGFPGSWGIAHGVHTYYSVFCQHSHGGEAPFTVVLATSPDGGESRELYRTFNYSLATRPRISPDGRSLAFLADLDTPNYAVANSVVRIDLKTGKAQRLTTALDAADLQWGSDGRIYVLIKNGGLQQLSAIDPNGRIEQLTHDAVNRRTLVATADAKTLAYITTDGFGERQIRTWSILSHREKVAVEIANPGSSYALGAFHPVSWATPDGLSINGFVVLPPGFHSDHRYPMLVDVHGGGPGAPLYLFGFFGMANQTPLDWHAWAARGYVVFAPDYRSGGEYGSAVNVARETVRGGDTSGIEQDAADVKAGVEWMLRQGYIDPTRIALFGHSAGGPRAAILLERTRLFSAGILNEAIPFGPQGDALADVVEGLPVAWSGQALTDEERQAQLKGFVFDGWRAATPTLIMTGDVDKGGVDPLSAKTFYALQRSMHVPSRFLRFLDEGHVPATPESSLQHFLAVKDWLDRYAPAGPEDRAL